MAKTDFKCQKTENKDNKTEKKQKKSETLKKPNKRKNQNSGGVEKKLRLIRKNIKTVKKKSTKN